MKMPWLFDGFAACSLKSTRFVGGFVVLAAVELADRKPDPATDAGPTLTQAD